MQESSDLVFNELVVKCHACWDVMPPVSRFFLTGQIWRTDKNVRRRQRTQIDQYFRTTTEQMGNSSSNNGALAVLSQKLEAGFADVAATVQRVFGQASSTAPSAVAVGVNFLTPHFHHALFEVTEYLTVEEVFRLLATDRTLHRLLSSHTYTWLRLFRRVCVDAGESGRYDVEARAILEHSNNAQEQISALKLRILHHFQDRLRHEKQHFEAMYQFNHHLYQYCTQFKPSKAKSYMAVQSHGLFGVSANLFKFPTRELAECLALKRKTAARFFVMDTMMHPPAFKKTLPTRRGLGPSYLTLDMAAAQARAAEEKAKAFKSSAKQSIADQIEAGALESRLTLPDLSRVPGFIGYAANLVQVRPQHEELLRNTVCWAAFMHLAVFERQADGEKFVETLPPQVRDRVWYCGLDFAPPADRVDEPRFRRGYNFAYGSEFRPMVRQMLSSGQTPSRQLQTIRRKLHSLNQALEQHSER